MCNGEASASDDRVQPDSAWNVTASGLGQGVGGEGPQMV